MRNTLLLLWALGLTSAAFADEHDHGDVHDHEHEHGEALRDGHMDLLVLYEAEEGLHLAIAAGEHDHDHDHSEEATSGEGEGHDHEHGEHEALDHVEIVGGAKAVQTTPAGDAWAFLGEANRFVYVLPQAETHGLPFLGINTEELDDALLAVESDLTMRLIEVEGPGSFALYQVDAFGQPLILLQSMSETADSMTLPRGTHFHSNWAFSAPGEYELTFELTGTLADGTPLTSEPQTVHFDIVGQPTYVHEGETVVALEYDDAHGLEFSLIIEDDDHDHEEGHGEESHEMETGEDDHDHEHEHGEGMHPTDAILVLGGYAVATVPEVEALSFLGEPGSTIYLIGQSEEEGVPYLGWDADELDAATFTGDPVLELHEVEGPGDLFLYTVDSLGEVTVIWNTADPAEDILTMPTGTHAHYNLAVTVPGTYELEIHAEATLAEGMEVDAHTEIILQAGGLEGYLGHFERPAPDWVIAETGGMFYTAAWPWLWNDAQGWLYAVGDGGPDHLYYQLTKDGWLWTSPSAFPAYWSYGSGEWLTW